MVNNLVRLLLLLTTTTVLIILVQLMMNNVGGTNDWCGGYLRLTPSAPLLVLIVPVSTGEGGGGGYQLLPVKGTVSITTQGVRCQSASCSNIGGRSRGGVKRILGHWSSTPINRRNSSAFFPPPSPGRSTKAPGRDSDLFESSFLLTTTTNASESIN